MPAVIPIIAAVAGSVASGAMANSAAGSNAAAAQNTANMEMGATTPYSMNTGLGFTNFYSGGGNGGSNSVTAQLTPQYSNMQNGLLGSAAGWLGGLDATGANGGLNPLLANAYMQYQNSLPNASGLGFPALAGQAFGNLGTASNFNQAANNALGSLTSFNPATAGANYSNLLGRQSAPANTLAAQNLTQQLFNSGALGSTGGANALTALGNMQGNQWVGQQLAGQQLGMQQEGLVGNLANQLGYTGNMLNSTNYGLGSNLNNMLFGRQYQLGQQGLQNAIAMNQAGNQTLGTYSGLAQGLLGSGLGINQALLNQMQVGGQLGAARTGAAVNAGSTALQGQLAANNTAASSGMGLVSALTNANWGGLFNQSISPSDANYWSSGAPANNAMTGWQMPAFTVG